MGKIIIVEDSKPYLDYVMAFLKSNGWETEFAMSVQMAKKLIKKADCRDIILSDMRLVGGEATDLLEWMRKEKISNPMIVMTRFYDAPPAVNALKLGAKDFINKLALEIDLPPMLETLRKELESKYGKKGFGTKPIFNRPSAAYQSVLEQARRVASSDMPVLITGESGSGKEHIARRIHDCSPRWNKPYDKVDCGTLREEMAVSVLFGHEKGSFTGAIDRHKGLFEVADGGTLFLDEIGNLSVDVQTKLLSAMEDKLIRPLGAEKTKLVDVRVVAATNEDLLKAVQEGRFRNDLWYRLTIFPIHVPALRECKEDILPLAEFFLKTFKGDKELKGISPDAKKMLKSHDWPGNVRELKNVMSRAIVYAKGGEIASEDIIFDNLPKQKGQSMLLKDPDEEKQKIINALKATGGNVEEAARLLGIGRTSMYTKLQVYGIAPNDYRKRS